MLQCPEFHDLHASQGLYCVQGWLKNPPAPRPAPRIPAGLAQQHLDAPMPVNEPATTQSALASTDGPFVNPDALLSQPAPMQNLPEASTSASASVQLRTTEAPTAGATGALGEEQQVQEFQGELMTFNEAKGWERVAMVQSRGWPPGVPAPQCAPSPPNCKTPDDAEPEYYIRLHHTEYTSQNKNLKIFSQHAPHCVWRWSVMQRRFVVVCFVDTLQGLCMLHCVMSVECSSYLRLVIHAGSCVFTNLQPNQQPLQDSGRWNRAAKPTVRSSQVFWAISIGLQARLADANAWASFVLPKLKR